MSLVYYLQVSPDCVYIRITDCILRNTLYGLNTPSQYQLHGIVIENVDRATPTRCVAKVMGVARGFYGDIPTVFPYRMQYVLHILVTCYTLTCSYFILAYAHHFHVSDGAAKVNTFVLSVWSSLLIDALLKQPAGISCMLCLQYFML